MEHGEQVDLLLSAPGQPPAGLPASPWRGWLPSQRGPVDPTTAAAVLRLSPVTPRAERALVAAVAQDDVDALGRLAAQGGPAQEAALVLAALRLATIDPRAAIELLQQLVASPTDPTAGKVLRKHWRDLTVLVDLAPGVPALVGLGRTAFALLAAELMVQVGRVADALTLLETLPPRPPVVLAKAATLLANGDHARVLEVTASLPNADDISALALVARSVASRSLDDVAGALDAVCEALGDTDRSGAVLAAALEERAHLYSLAGDTVAAHADLEALAALAGGDATVAVPARSTLRRTDEPTEADSLDRARQRIRRRITGVGAPGTFGGRHHSTYRDEIATMFALGQVDAVEELLLGLLDVVEDEVDELGVPLDATFFLTLADLYQDSGRTEELHALRERYAEAEARAARRAAEGHAAPSGAVDLAKRASAAAAAPAEPDVEPAADGGGEQPDEVLAQRLVSVLAGSPPPAAAAPATSETARPAPGAPAGEAPAGATSAREAPAGEAPAGPTSGASAQPAVGDLPVERAAAVEPPEGDAPASAATDDVAPSGDRPDDAVDLAERRRELTPVERAVRGPRVRSL